MRCVHACACAQATPALQALQVTCLACSALCAPPPAAASASEPSAGISAAAAPAAAAAQSARCSLEEEDGARSAADAALSALEDAAYCLWPALRHVRLQAEDLWAQPPSQPAGAMAAGGRAGAFEDMTNLSLGDALRDGMAPCMSSHAVQVRRLARARTSICMHGSCAHAPRTPRCVPPCLRRSRLIAVGCQTASTRGPRAASPNRVTGATRDMTALLTAVQPGSGPHVVRSLCVDKPPLLLQQAHASSSSTARLPSCTAAAGGTGRGCGMRRCRQGVRGRRRATCSGPRPQLVERATLLFSDTSATTAKCCWKVTRLVHRTKAGGRPPVEWGPTRTPIRERGSLQRCTRHPRRAPFRGAPPRQRANEQLCAWLLKREGAASLYV